MPLHRTSRCRPALAASTPSPPAVADCKLVETAADATSARELWGVLRPSMLISFSKQREAMRDLMEKYRRLHEQGQQWLKREQEFVGVLLWAVGITTLAALPDTGMFDPVHPPVFVG